LPASVSQTPSSLAWSAREAGARDAAIGATPDGSIAEPPQEAVTAIFAQATWEWILRGARRCERTLTLVRLAPVQRVENTRDLWHTTVLVRDERSGAEHSFWLRGQAPSAPATDWRLFFGDSDIASVFKLYAASEWLDAHPDVFAVTRQRPDGREGVIWSLATTQGTTVCVSMSHAHGPTLEGCWSERGPLMPVPAFAWASYGCRSTSTARCDAASKAAGERCLGRCAQCLLLLLPRSDHSRPSKRCSGTAEARST
jgi:hypothetical protein